MTEATLTPHLLPTLGVVLVAAGRGERLGAGVPKAFVELEGRTLIEHCVTTVTSLPHSGHLVIVVPQGSAADALHAVQRATPVPGSHPWEVSVVAGGRERHESVRFGIAALPDSVEVVLVHDAARPLASTALFERVRETVVRTGDAVIPTLPVTDTIKRVTGDTVHETLDRSDLVAVQTPQGFLRESLAAAHELIQLRAGAEGDPTDDAEVIQRAGGTVRTVLGEQRAHKLTTPDDVLLLTTFLTTPLPRVAETTTA